MNFSNSIKDGIRGIFCDLAQGAAEFQEWFTTFPVPGGGPSNDIELFKRYNYARLAYRNLCNREPPPAPTPQFPGGRCECRDYRAVWQVFDGVNTSVAERIFPGPIDGLFMREAGGGAQELYWRHGVCTPLDFYTGQGETVVFFGGVEDYRVISIEPVDGGPDECGSAPLPEPPPPPGWNETDIDITYEGDDGNTYNLTFPIVFGYADVDINGNFRIPFRINVAPNFTGNFDIWLNGRFTFGGPGGDGPDFDIDFNFGGNDRDDRRVGPGGGCRSFPVDIDFDDDDDDGGNRGLPFDGTDDEEPRPEEPDKERVIRAAWVVVTQNTAGFPTTIPQQENPDVYVPDLGLISFGIRTGKRSIGWTTDIRVKNSSQFIPCPWEGGAIFVKGTPRPGVTWEVIPLYSDVEVPITYPE